MSIELIAMPATRIITKKKQIKNWYELLQKNKFCVYCQRERKTNEEKKCLQCKNIIDFNR